MVKWEKGVALSAVWFVLALFLWWDITHDNWRLVLILEVPVLVGLTIGIALSPGGAIARRPR